MMKRTGILCASCLAAYHTKSQELEPRAYAALPKNLNSVALVYGVSRGNVLIDPSLPVRDLKLTNYAAGAGYVRTFGFLNKLARVQVTIPYVFISGKVQINGHDTSASRSGFADAKLRLGINLTGSPPLDKHEFTKYTEKTIVGVSLVTSVPTGTYDPSKRINMGSNRWAFKPEVGVSKRFGRVYTEMYAGVWFYTKNTNFLNDKTLEQKPVLNLQAHGSYFFRNRMMLSLNTVWFDGGQTIVDNVEQGALLNNWRVGGTWAFPVARMQSLRLQFHVGAVTASGYDYNTLSIAYMCLF